MLPLITQLTDLGERQGPVTLLASQILTRQLERNQIPYVIESLETFLPVASSKLLVDGELIDSLPTSFIGGTIESKEALVSSLIPTRYLIDVPNINFNPRSVALSRPNFYFAPSLAVRRQEIEKILAATTISGEVTVKKTLFSLPQILVGNRENPSTIIFSHYDSIGPGAIDNASGTIVCLDLLTKNPSLLTTTLFVFDPNEELSYDFPTYWGHGYRVFESRYKDLLESTAKIIVVDCVGNGEPQIISDPKIVNLAFPVASLASLLSKTVTIGGDIDTMMEVYQGDTDLPSLLSEEMLIKTRDLVKSLIV
jgi:hypothetical protein